MKKEWLELMPYDPERGFYLPEDLLYQRLQAELPLITKRFLINLGVSLTDVIPLFGETASWGADGIKLMKHHLRAKYDLTPDVRARTAILTELLDLGLPVPSHVIETVLQARIDSNRRKTNAELIMLERQGVHDYNRAIHLYARLHNDRLRQR